MDTNPSSVYTVIGARNVGFLSVRRRKINDDCQQGLCGVVKFIKTCECRLWPHVKKSLLRIVATSCVLIQEKNPTSVLNLVVAKLLRVPIS